MAARKNAQINERAREAIKTTQLVKRLNAYALNETGDQGEAIEMDNTRLKAIEILLRKTLPDLSAIKHEGDGENGEIVFRTIYEKKPDNL